MKVYLFRHGKSEPGSEGPFLSCLTDEGRMQGQKLVESGVLPVPDRIYSSHFPRAMQSANILALHFGLEYHVREGLGEWKIQEQNIPFEEYQVQELAAMKDLDLVVSGGESFSMAGQRFYNEVSSICNENQTDSTLFLVAHGYVNYLMFKRIEGLDAFKNKDDYVGNFDYGILDYSRGIFKIEKNIITRR